MSNVARISSQNGCCQKCFFFDADTLDKDMPFTEYAFRANNREDKQ
jgi:hypothetical protein